MRMMGYRFHCVISVTYITSMTSLLADVVENSDQSCCQHHDNLSEMEYIKLGVEIRIYQKDPCAKCIFQKVRCTFCPIMMNSYALHSKMQFCKYLRKKRKEQFSFT